MISYLMHHISEEALPDKATCDIIVIIIIISYLPNVQFLA